MQNFSILQLLKTLSAASADTSVPAVEEKQKNCADNATHTPDETPKNNEAAVCHDHARTKEEKATYAYETFLTRHEQAVRRVKKHTEN